MIANFEQPLAENRVKPFWFWNGELKEEELLRQLREMKEQGIGGIFISPRQGMRVPYLSEKYFQLVRYTTELAKSLGLETWIYDEYPYPSGMSGGEVTLLHPEAKQTVLKHFSVRTGGGPLSVELGWGNILFARAVCVSGSEPPMELMDKIGIQFGETIYQESGSAPSNLKRYFEYGPRKHLFCTLPKGDWKVEICWEAERGNFKYYGCYMDPCNRDAVRCFLNTTHERYKKAVGDYFGTEICGVFTDETGLVGGIPWSHMIPEAFKEENGYCLTDHMDALYDRTVPDAYRVRYAMYRTAHHLLRENYHHQISDWCARHRLQYVTEVPGMRMTTQKYSHIIGGDFSHDKLGTPLEDIYNNSIYNFRHNPRAIASYARQTGRRYALIESFHSVGWSMTLQDAKWMIDYLAACGISLFNFHAFCYTIDGLRKYDAPPSQFFQNPYWKYYRKFADYAARLSTVWSQTHSVCRIAVLAPVASFWVRMSDPFNEFSYKGEDSKESKELETLKEDWNFVCKALSRAQIPFEHLDPELLQDARIEDSCVVIGNAEYDLLILTPNSCMESFATDFLEKFAKVGGKLLGLGLLPSEKIDEDNDPEKRYQALFGCSGTSRYWEKADRKPELRTLAHRPISFWETTGSVKDAGEESCWLQRVNELSPQPVRLSFQPPEAEKSFVLHLREDDERNLWVFLTNQEGTPTSVEISLSAGVLGAKLYDLEKGSVRPLSVQKGTLSLHFDPYESCLVRLEKGKTLLQEPSEAEEYLIDLNRPFKMSLQRENLLRLDRFEMMRPNAAPAMVDAKTYLEQLVQSGQISAQEIDCCGGFGLPKKMELHYPVCCTYRTDFQAEYIPSDLSVRLDKETIGGSFTMTLNGKTFSLKDFEASPLYDQNNLRCPVADAARIGNNELSFTVQIQHDWDGLTDAVLLGGSFSLRREAENFVMIPPLREGTVSGRYPPGAPFYSGEAVYEGTFEAAEDLRSPLSLRFSLPEPIYECVEASVNGKSLGVRPFTPYKWDLPCGLLQKGKNSVRVSVLYSLSNCLEGSSYDYKSMSMQKN